MESTRRRSSAEAVRCGSCSRVLFKARPTAIVEGIELKCPRCGAINSFFLRPAEPSRDRPRAADDIEDS